MSGNKNITDYTIDKEHNLKQIEMTTKKKILIVLSVGVIIAVGIAATMFFKPHRDVQETATDYRYEASEIVNEYLTDADKANEKYLDEGGNSKVLEISGTVADISEDFNHQKVLLLKEATDKAGVNAVFTKETNVNTQNIEIGKRVTVKGVIRSGATYDEDLEMYENVILEKSDLIISEK